MKAVSSIKAQQISYKRQTCQPWSRRHVPELIQLNQLIKNQQENDGKENISKSEIFWQQQLHLWNKQMRYSGSWRQVMSRDGKNDNQNNSYCEIFQHNLQSYC